ncbi:hypothetical protein CS006_02165 [Bifidobacterium primatium]|uniref:Uncharacterized protein n=1 Tax=Bifidobacterium primatium TaxID=2045438 RepID=A0A2M9HAY1_9BIFI|nr:hypothetical protein CS006_02165 [Bifidobacterium primatium]
MSLMPQADSSMFGVTLFLGSPAALDAATNVPTTAVMPYHSTKLAMHEAIGVIPTGIMTPRRTGFSAKDAWPA